MTWTQRVIKATASLKLAVVVILSLGMVAAIGTIVESKYDAVTAQKWVYNSPYMYVIVCLLCVNLIGVMVDRWPWKRRHTGFLMAHVGILITILGAWVTKEFGIDGSLQVSVGQKNRFVILSQPELTVASYWMKAPPEVLLREDMSFLGKAKLPLTYKWVGGGSLRVNRYIPYAIPQERILPSQDQTKGAALRFQLFNEKLSEVHWLLIQRGQSYSDIQLGPAQVVLSNDAYKHQGGHVILVEIQQGHLNYRVYSGKKSSRKARLR